jgi:protein-S-isoprenylcysteine O-methyltransferase Ste14
MKMIYLGLVPVLWLGWLGYWAAAAVGTKTTARSESMGSRLTYLAPLLLGGILLGTPHWPALLNHRVVPRDTAIFWIAVALVVLGLGLSVLARRSLGTNWSGTVTLKQDHELVRAGPYRFVRHPIYSGLLLAILGTALIIGRWRALAAVVLIAAGFIRKLGIEEQFMTGQFGDAYRRYMAEVPALIPFVF